MLESAIAFVERVQELEEGSDGLGAESMEDFQDIEIGRLTGDALCPPRSHVSGSEVACGLHCDRRCT